MCIGALLAVMAALRALYLLEFGEHANKSGDAEFFLALARRIAGGDVLLRGESLVFSPLYFYFLGAVFAVVGESHRWVLALQFALGIGSALLVHRLAREIFGPLSALLTLALCAFYGLVLVYEGQLMDASFSVLLPSAFLFLFHRAGRSRRATAWFPAGVVLGLFFLTRPNGLIFLPLAAAWVFLRAKESVPAGRRAVATAALIGGTALAVLPVTLRNRAVTGEPVLLTSHGGINFYVGNNEHATGFFTPPPGMPPLPGVFNREIPRSVAERETGRTGMSDSEVSSYWFGRGFSFIRGNPAAFVRLTLRKTRALFNAREIPINVDFEFLREISSTLRIAFVPYGVVLPLGLIGMALPRGRRRENLFLHLYFASYALSVVLFFVTARYRLPLVPVLLVHAGFALRTLLARVGEPRAAAAPAVALAALLVVVNADLGVRFDPAILAHGRGYTLQTMGREDEAVAYYEEALRLNPRLVLTHLHLARIHAFRGAFDAANRHYEAAARLSPQDAALQEEWRKLRGWIADRPR
jgi:4-amino-4-deoxy-L-arabinose transferase-like glycosyltransferase